MDRTRLAELWARGQRGWPADHPIAQFPNPPLLVALVGWAVSAVSDGTVHDAGRAVFSLGLAIWAYLELTSGVNLYRRVAGGGVLIYVTFEVAQGFGA